MKGVKGANKARREHKLIKNMIRVRAKWMRARIYRGRAGNKGNVHSGNRFMQSKMCRYTVKDRSLKSRVAKFGKISYNEFNSHEF